MVQLVFELISVFALIVKDELFHHGDILLGLDLLFDFLIFHSELFKDHFVFLAENHLGF